MVFSFMETACNQRVHFEVPLLTALLVKCDLGLEFLTLLKGVINVKDHLLAGVRPVQELACAALLHDLTAREAR